MSSSSLVAVATLSVACLTSAFAQTKDDAASQLAAIFSQLRDLGRHSDASDPTPETRMRIDKLISEQLQPEQLFRLGALTCVTAFPQEAGSDILYDAVFAYASRRCAILLSKRADSSSADLLARLQPLCGRDGGEKLMYDELIERQKKLAPHAP